jgi:hypothetical protein
MKILPDGAFPTRTLYLQFSRCAHLTMTRFLMWLNTLPLLDDSVKVALEGRGFKP